MTTNQVIVLMDVRRGWTREAHCGTLKGDVKHLICRDLIRKAGSDDHFPYELTNAGSNMCDEILQVASNT